MPYSQLSTGDKDAWPDSEKQSVGRLRSFSARRISSGACWIILLAIYAFPWILYLRKPVGFVDLGKSPNELTVDEVGITYKTGASTIQRVQIHLDSELNRTLPNFQIYSDSKQTLQNGQGTFEVIDILEDLEPRYGSQPDFKLYIQQKEKLQRGGKLSTGYKKIDKYKFLPLQGDAYRRFPNVKYTINIEDDTYVFLDNLLRWLSPLNPRGFAVYAHPTPTVSGIWFPYGGSGYVISAGLLDATFGRDYDETLRAADQSMSSSCCGDELLGIAMFKRRPGVDLNGPDLASFHMFTTDPPEFLSFWQDTYCLPILTMHHFEPHHVREVYGFEKALWPRLRPDDFIRRCDIFKHFAPDFLHSLAGNEVIQSDWANMPQIIKPFNYIYGDPEAKPVTVDTIEACSAECSKWDECLMWEFVGPLSQDNCFLGNIFKIGVAQSNHTSGWRMDRIRAFQEKQPCHNRRMLL